METSDLEGFQKSQSGAFSVTVLDYDRDRLNSPQPNLNPDFDGALMTVGKIGAFLCDALRLKTGDL